MKTTRRGMLGWALGALGGAAAVSALPTLGIIDRIALKLATWVKPKPKPWMHGCIYGFVELRDEVGICIITDV